MQDSSKEPAAPSNVFPPPLNHTLEPPRTFHPSASLNSFFCVDFRNSSRFTSLSLLRSTCKKEKFCATPTFRSLLPGSRLSLLSLLVSSEGNFDSSEVQTLKVFVSPSAATRLKSNCPFFQTSLLKSLSEHKTLGTKSPTVL